MRQATSMLHGIRRRLLGSARGQVLAIAALALPVILGAGALAVDVGYMYVARSALQNAADAGARAGASVLAAGGTQADASAAATNFANQNINSNAFLAGAQPVVNFPTATSLQVSFNFNLPLFFAPVLGVNTAAVPATAAAGINPVAGVGPGNLVPLGVYCNNPGGCTGVLAVGQTLTTRRYCGNFFQDGPGGNACGNAVGNGEIFLQGMTFDENSNSNSLFRERVYSGYDIDVNIDDAARALPGNRNGWRSGMENRLTEGRNEMTLAVIRELSPASQAYNIQVVDFIQVRVLNFQQQGNTDQTTFEIIRSSVSSTNFAQQGQGLGINSVVGVRLSQ